jgi:phosphoribosyl-AMP cyclohydrolase
MSEIEKIPTEKFIASLKFDQNKLIPAIVQDAHDGTILMLGYMNLESVQRTIAEGKVTFWSRSRQKFWTKGETSGHFLTVIEIYSDCDRDSLLLKVDPEGPTCHTNKRSCFSWQLLKK